MCIFARRPRFSRACESRRGRRAAGLARTGVVVDALGGARLPTHVRPRRERLPLRRGDLVFFMQRLRLGCNCLLRRAHWLADRLTGLRRHVEGRFGVAGGRRRRRRSGRRPRRHLALTSGAHARATTPAPSAAVCLNRDCMQPTVVVGLRAAVCAAEYDGLGTLAPVDRATSFHQEPGLLSGPLVNAL